MITKKHLQDLINNHLSPKWSHCGSFLFTSWREARTAFKKISEFLGTLADGELTKNDKFTLLQTLYALNHSDEAQLVDYMKFQQACLKLIYPLLRGEFTSVIEFCNAFKNSNRPPINSDRKRVKSNTSKKFRPKLPTIEEEEEIAITKITVTSMNDLASQYGQYVFHERAQQYHTGKGPNISYLDQATFELLINYENIFIPNQPHISAMNIEIWALAYFRDNIDLFLRDFSSIIYNTLFLQTHLLVDECLPLSSITNAKNKFHTVSSLLSKKEGSFDILTHMISKALKDKKQKQEKQEKTQCETQYCA